MNALKQHRKFSDYLAELRLGFKLKRDFVKLLDKEQKSADEPAELVIIRRSVSRNLSILLPHPHGLVRRRGGATTYNTAVLKRHDF